MLRAEVLKVAESQVNDTFGFGMVSSLIHLIGHF